MVIAATIMMVLVVLQPVHVNAFESVDARLGRDHKFWINETRCDDFFGTNYTDATHHNDTRAKPYNVRKIAVKDGKVIFHKFDTKYGNSYEEKTYDGVEGLTLCIGKSANARGFYVRRPTATNIPIHLKFLQFDGDEKMEYSGYSIEDEGGETYSNYVRGVKFLIITFPGIEKDNAIDAEIQLSEEPWLFMPYAGLGIMFLITLHLTFYCSTVRQAQRDRAKA